MFDNNKKEKIALILVDIQNDFLENGSLAVAHSLDILKPVKKLIQQVKEKDGLIVASQDWHPKDHISFASNHSDINVFETKEIEYEGTTITQVMWPDHCVQNSLGAQISEEIDIKDIDFIVKKGVNPYVDSYGAFADNNYSEITSLAKILYQHFIDTVVIVGLATDYCVKYTCLDAIKFGFKTILVKEGTKPVNADQLEATLSELAAKGVIIV
ncbi:Isochorismatase-like protein [Cokeromyces recurvatus]|uniref:Isochorismatase-like protein n=1 Tax=Cokeromyces recurvatus TaxID=90255 RepID=UPI00221E3C52|nr:Isochorismatase-like protein [Cokeromyces recurvatus]KAI7902049.1 Isochorismatase-like protein [Cokeromyces recurvatus]